MNSKNKAIDPNLTLPMRDYASLKAYHREHRDTFHINLSLRVHRALSWLNRAEQEADDPDAQFIFLWIAFNSCYAVEVDPRYRERAKRQIMLFFKKVSELDSEKELYDSIWKTYSGTIRALLDNYFVYQPFWDYHNSMNGTDDWKIGFEKAKAAARKGLQKQNTPRVLAILFDRLYTLRNQLVHGGATWNSAANRAQVKDCTALMATVVPIIIHVMMTHPNTLWGEPHYPVVKESK